MNDFLEMVILGLIISLLSIILIEIHNTRDIIFDQSEILIREIHNQPLRVKENEINKELCKQYEGDSRGDDADVFVEVFCERFRPTEYN